MAVFRTFILLLISHVSRAATEFSISNSGVSCSGALQVDSLSVDCGGGYCTFGSAVSVEGAGTSCVGTPLMITFYVLFRS